MGESETRELEVLRDKMILEETNTFMMEYDLISHKCYVDSAQKKMIQGDWEELINEQGACLEDFIVKNDIEKVKQFMDFSTLQSGERRKTKARIYVKPHSYEWFRISMACLQNEQGENVRVLLTFSNAEQELETTRQLKFLLSRDSLTYLYNLDSFCEICEGMMEKNPDSKYAFIQMDIEKFHIINQLYGTKEGDNILRYLGVKVQECVEQGYQGTYCRIASDKMGICMKANEDDIQEVIDYLQESMKHYPINFEMIMAFGVYITDEMDYEEKIPVSTLLDRAAAAKLTVKNNYFNHVGWYDETIRKQEEAEQVVISEMKQALENGQFQVYLQPKCEIGTGKIIGSEALVRWIHPTRGLIAPDKFIPIFEKNGFISEIDMYMCEMTCKIIQGWIDNGMPAYPISVNLSRLDLYNPKVLEAIDKCVAKYDIPSELIEFEITESAFVSDEKPLQNLVEQLRKKHHAILMDDFGSGYSSLNTLKSLNVDVLKVDLKFLPSTKEDDKANVIIESIVDMAMRLGLKVIVEGVETQEQAEFLNSIGCQMVQGFYFYKPMPVVEYNTIIK